MNDPSLVTSKDLSSQLREVAAMLRRSAPNNSGMRLNPHLMEAERIVLAAASALEPPVAWAEYVGGRIVGVYENSPVLLDEAKARSADLVPLYSRPTQPPGAESIESILTQAKGLIFSKRRRFWAYLETCLTRSDGDNGESYKIAWPDGFMHLGREEFAAALEHATGPTKEEGQ